MYCKCKYLSPQKILEKRGFFPIIFLRGEGKGERVIKYLN